MLTSLVVVYVYKKQRKQTARSGKLNNMQGTAPRLPPKNRPHQTPCRTATACPPTKRLRGICHLTLEGRLQAPNDAPLTLVLAVGPRQTAAPICRRPPPHRRLRPAASLTGRYVANCFNQPWFECGSLRSTGWASTAARRGCLSLLRRLRPFSSCSFCNNR